MYQPKVATVARERVGGPCLALDQANITRPRALLRILWREFHPLTFPKQLEDGSADRAAVEKVLDPTLVADETEPLVDEESCNCPGWHKRRLRSPMLARTPG